MRRTIPVGALACLLLGGCAGLFSNQREPLDTWFRAYPGPMLPIDRVAIVCKDDTGARILTIQGSDDPKPLEARYEKWHFPQCIEVLPGRYELQIGYFARRSNPLATATTTTETPVPIKVDWWAEAGGTYLMRVLFGSAQPAAGRPYRKDSPFGAARGEWSVGRWEVRIEPVASFDALAEPVLEHRENWRRYENAGR